MLKTSAALLILSMVLCASAGAQPSGGPYGPVQMVYEVPEGAGRVYYVAPNGHADASGATVDEATTIESAIGHVDTEDVIVMRGGVYRTGGLMLNRGVTIQPYRDERPILKGTRVATDWEPLRDGLWRIKWDTLFPMSPQDWWRREREAKRTPLYKFNNDMVFVDGRMLHARGWAGEVDEDTYWIDYEKGYIYIGTDPAGKLLEITAHDGALTRTLEDVHGKTSDGKGVTVRGVTFTQYAYRAIEIRGNDPEGVSSDTEHGGDVVGSVFEHCTFSHCSRVGGYFRGDGLTIRNCLVTDTGTEGLYILASDDVLLEKNIVTRTNVEGITGYFSTAIKIFNQCHRVTCRDNLVIDNPGVSGIWYDVGNVDGVFINNWIETTDNGFFFEISQGAICAGNVFVDCFTGIRILNSRGVRVYNNTLVNSRLRIGRTERSAVGDHFGWHPATGPDVDERDGHEVVGNLLVADEGFGLPLVEFEQAPGLRDTLKDPQVSAMDRNVYVRRSAEHERPLIVWSPADSGDGSLRLDSPEKLHAAYNAFAGQSKAYPHYHGPLFHGEHLRRFELSPMFPGATSDAPPPADALKLLGWSAESAAHPGAYPSE